MFSKDISVQPLSPPAAKVKPDSASAESDLSTESTTDEETSVQWGNAFCIGEVRHRRLWPKNHQFTYPLYYTLLDLDQLDTCFSQHPLWSVNRFNWVQFKRSDYLGQSGHLKEAVIARILAETGEAFHGRIYLQTHLRYLGFCFNPVSFYYCVDDSERLRYIVAEITNTPWGERHSYVLPVSEDDDVKSLRFQFDKQFHVSPFLPMNLRYEWIFRLHGELTFIHMNVFRENSKLFDATLRMHHQKMTRRRMTTVPLKFPLITVRVAIGIYWQALKLWLKRVPFFTHPDKQVQE